jgi:hypothetical protein
MVVLKQKEIQMFPSAQHGGLVVVTNNNTTLRLSMKGTFTKLPILDRINMKVMLQRSTKLKYGIFIINICFKMRGNQTVKKKIDLHILFCPVFLLGEGKSP